MVPKLSTSERVLQLITSVAYLGLVGWGYLVILAEDPVKLIYDFQTLIGGALAILGAGIGAWFLARQTAQADRHESERVHRRMLSVRTVLPLALSSITRYAVDAAAATKQLLDQCEGENLPDRSKLKLPENPAIPSEAITTLREMVETLPPGQSIPFAILVADLQVQAARLSESIAKAGDKEKILARTNLEEYIIDCALIYARASSLFGFGRGMVDAPAAEITWNDVAAPLYFFEMLDTEYDSIREKMTSRSGGDMANPVKARWTARTF